MTHYNRIYSKGWTKKISPHPEDPHPWTFLYFRAGLVGSRTILSGDPLQGSPGNGQFVHIRRPTNDLPLSDHKEKVSPI